MAQIKTIIVDDEKAARDVLSSLLVRNCPNVEIIAVCSNLADAVSAIKQQPPDIVFLDVQMPKQAGYEIVNYFEEINFEIVFVTAYDEYAIKAFELNALDYILKPIERSLLINSINKIDLKVEQKKALMEYQILLKSFKDKKLKKIVIPELGNRRILNLDNILAIEANGAYCKIYLHEEKPFLITKNLKYFEKRLDDEVGFFRSHRAWIVNLNYVQYLNKAELSITLVNSLKAKISRPRLKIFEKAIV